MSEAGCDACSVSEAATQRCDSFGPGVPAYFVMVAYFYGWQVYSNVNTVMSIFATIGDMKLRQENPDTYKDDLYVVTGIGLAESGIMCKCAPSLVDVSEEYEITVGIYELCQACLTAIRLCFGELRVAIVSLLGFGH